jgi:hypothetical protein
MLASLQISVWHYLIRLGKNTNPSASCGDCAHPQIHSLSITVNRCSSCQISIFHIGREAYFSDSHVARNYSERKRSSAFGSSVVGVASLLLDRRTLGAVVSLILRRVVLGEDAAIYGSRKGVFGKRFSHRFAADVDLPS